MVVRADPFNAETAPSALDQVLTPVADFYVRSNFAVPDIDPSGWSIRVDGRVDRPQTLTLDDIRALSNWSITCTLECAGNNRRRLEPTPEGEPWGSGAISTAEFSGVPLVELLDRAGIASDALEVRFEGADHGNVEGRSGEIQYERSLPIDVARREDVLVATSMGGEPLTAEHGAPARLLVPGWYGMASVKWLRRIELIDRPLEAHFQTVRYRYHPAVAAEDRVARPVTTIRVNSMITSLAPGDVLSAGRHRIFGAAWSGSAPIVAVGVSIDGNRWQSAELTGSPQPTAWRRWQYDWSPQTDGAHTLRTRATAADGTTQPDQIVWNRLGYGNNAINEIVVQVRRAT